MKKMSKVIVMVLFVVVIAISAIGCGKAKDDKNKDITIVDMAGDEVTLTGKINSIACTWPSGTQLFITLGMSDLLVAVPADSKEQSWAMHMAPAVKDLPLCSNDLSAEEILKLNADVLITTEADVARELRSKGICAITVKYYSVEEMKQAISLIAKIVDSKYEKTCTKYISYLEKQIDDVKNALEGKVTNLTSLYYIHGGNNKGLYKTAGANTMNEAWAKYAYTDFVTSTLLDSSETKVDAEAVLAKNPQFIVIGGRYQHVLYNELMATAEWETIDAVVNEKVVKAPMGVSPFDRFGAEFAMMIPWLANQVYPDLFTYDAKKEIKEFYKEFSGYSLTDDEVMYIINGLMPDGSREIE